MKSGFLLIIKSLSKSFYKMGKTVLWILEVVFKTDLKNHVRKVEGADTLTILANGPSLKEDMSKIDFSRGHFSVVNDFYKSPYYKMLKPAYYVIADPVYFEENENIMHLVREVDWNMKLLVPYYAWKKIDLLRRCPNQFIEVVPYNTIIYNGFECFRNSVYKKGLSIPKVQNVLAASIFTGINMGYKEINLYGVDHSWTQTLGVNSMNQVCAVDYHFYDKEKPKFSPYNKIKMHELLRAFAFMFESYHFIRKYADYRGCRIINCTKDSFIDAFERL